MTIPPAVAPVVCGMRRNIREPGQHVPSRAYYIGWRVKKQRNRKIFSENGFTPDSTVDILKISTLALSRARNPEIPGG